MSRRNKAFVMGHPIAHSRSPLMHGHWLKTLGITGSYERLDVAPADIDTFFAGFRDAGWVGGNVTVPHKSAVIPHLAGLDAAAEAMGAVNTIYWDGDDLVGGNADGIGFTHNLDDRAPGWDAGARRAVVIGAGGAARAATYALLERGLDVALCNRTVARAEQLAARFGKRVTAHGTDALPSLMADADLLAQTTSQGMIGQPPLTLDLAPLKPGAVVCDIVYVPLDTDLLKAARQRGHRTVDGLGMLMHQAVVGFTHWFGQTPVVTDELRKILTDDIKAKTPGA
ncbi:MAG TPA: shikimate dehydrogenase [Devosia sp.]|nr:shikimate dehydrogenase [Devosia sp.]